MKQHSFLPASPPYRGKNFIHLKRLLLLLLVLCQVFVAIAQQIDANVPYTPKLMPAKGHTAGVWSVQYSPDGKHTLTLGDQTAKIWDAVSGKLLLDLTGHAGAVWSAQYSPDGKHILTAGKDKMAKIWDAASGELLLNFAGHTSGVNSAQYSPDGKHILTASEDHTAKIWDAASGKLLLDLNGHTDWVWSAQYSLDGKHILTASRDHTAKIWDAASGELLLDLKGHTNVVWSAQYSLDGKHILTASEDKTAKIWDTFSGELLLDLNGHTDWVSSTQYSPGGKHILTASRDHTAKIWDAASGELLLDLPGHTDWVSSAQYSPDGKHILTAGRDQTAKIWDAASGELLLDLIGHTGWVSSAQYSPDGKHILTASYDHTAKIWDATSGELLLDLKGYTNQITSVQYSPDEKHILTSSYDHTAKIWDATSGEFLLDLKGHTAGVTSAKYSPDGKHILTASEDKTAKIWDATSGKLFLGLHGHTGWVSSVEYSPDGKHILTASEDKTAKIWDATLGKILLDLIGHAKTISSAEYSPDGKCILTASYDKTAKIWDAASGKLLLNLTGHTHWIRLAIYSPDGKHILTASQDHTAKIWDATSGKLLLDLTGHTGIVWSAQYSPDGKHIVTASEDKTAKIWDAVSGESLLDLSGHTSRIYSAQYSPDGEYILGASLDGSIIYWNAKTGKKLLTLYPLSKSNWVVLHPSGLYDASPEAMKWMYYVIDMEVIELEQLKERYYEPGLFKKVMSSEGTGLRDVKKLKSLDMYPYIETGIVNDDLQIRLKERNGGIGKVSIFINGKEVLADANTSRDTFISLDLKKFAKYYQADIVNHIGIRAYNANGWLKSQLITIKYHAGFINKKGQAGAQPVVTIDNYHPNYYAIVVGTSDYNGQQLDLRYADKDSKDMARALDQTAHYLFGEDKVHLEWFSTDPESGSKLASKENIQAAFESFSTIARPEDVLTIYFSGHGTTYGGTENEQFYYLTKDVYSGDLSDPAIRRSYAISTEELTQWVTAIPAKKQVMILDACSSGKVVEDLLAVRDIPTSQIRALDRMKDRTGMFVLAGSAADKVSYEASQFGQGLLTYSLLLGMSGGALREGRSVDVMQLFQFARDKVPDFAKDIGGIQTPTLVSPTDASSFDIGLVTEEVEIPLEEVKPVFIRSVFQEDESWGDVIGLSPMMDEYLLNTSAGLDSREFIFVDVNKYKNAYAVIGRYSLSGDRVVVRARLFHDEENVGGFEVTGDKRNLKGLVERILEEVNSILE